MIQFQSESVSLLGGGLLVLAVWVLARAPYSRSRWPDIATLMSAPVLMTNVATLLVGFGDVRLVHPHPDAGAGTDVDRLRVRLRRDACGACCCCRGRWPCCSSARFRDGRRRLGNKVPLAIGGFVTGLGLALLAVSHGSPLQVLLFCIVMSSGIGLAFAAMPNLVLEAVPARRPARRPASTRWSGRSAGRSGHRCRRRCSPSSAVAGVCRATRVHARVRGVSGHRGHRGCGGDVHPAVHQSARSPLLDAVGAAGPLAGAGVRGREVLTADERF